MRPWDRDAVHRLFDELEFRVLRERLFATLQSAEPEAEGGIEVQGGAIPAGRAAGLARRARPRRAPGRAGLPRRRRHRRRRPISRASGWPRASRPSRPGRRVRPRACRRRATSRSPRSPRTTRRRWGSGWPIRRVPKAAHDAKAGAARAARPWLEPRGAHQRHRAGRLPLPARPAQLRPGRSRAALPAPRAAAGRRGRGRPALAARRRGGGRRGAGHRADGRGVGGRRAGRRARRRAGREGGQRAARRAGAAAGVRAGRPGDGRHRRRPRRAGRAGGRVRRAGQAGRAGRLRGDRQGDQPRLAEAAAGRAVRRAGHAQDQAHQDRLHHRRRRAADPLRADRARVPVPPAGPPRRHPAQDHRRGPAQVGRRRRADPHHLQPDHRGHRAAVVHRAQPAERADPHRGRAAHPGDVHRRRRATRS